MTTAEIVTKYIAAMLPLVPHVNEFELILEAWETLTVEELKELNRRGYLFTGDLMEVEYEDNDGNIDGHYDIYYFKTVSLK
jgi:hypothetical protein